MSAKKKAEEAAAKAAEAKTKETESSTSKPDEGTDQTKSEGADPVASGTTPDPDADKTEGADPVTSGTTAEPLKSLPLADLPPPSPTTHTPAGDEGSTDEPEDTEKATEKATEGKKISPGVTLMEKHESNTDPEPLPLSFDGSLYKIGERRYTDLSHVLNELPAGTLLKIVRD